MSKNGGILTVVALAGAGVGGYLLLKNIGGIKKGIQETADTLEDYGKTVTENPVYDATRTATDNLGLTKPGDTPIKSSLELVKTTSNPVNTIGSIIGNFFSGIGPTWSKAVEDPVEDLKENISKINLSGGSANFVGTLTNFFTGLFTNKETNTGIKDRESMTSDTVLQNGKLVEKSPMVKMIEKTSGIEVKEIIGAPSTLTEEEKKNLTPTTFEEMATKSGFTGTIGKIALKVKEGGYTGNILQSLKK